MLITVYINKRVLLKVVIKCKLSIIRWNALYRNRDRSQKRASLNLKYISYIKKYFFIEKKVTNS